MITLGTVQSVTALGVADATSEHDDHEGKDVARLDEIVSDKQVGLREQDERHGPQRDGGRAERDGAAPFDPMQTDDRRRAKRSEGEHRHVVFEHGLLGPKPDDPCTNTPRRARVLRPLSWKRNGLLLLPDALLLRRGAIWRKLAIFPLARLQSIGIEQSPVDRALSVASIRAHTIQGRVSGRLGVIDRDAALGVFEDAEAAAITAASSDHSHRWANGESEEVSALAGPASAASVDGPEERL